MSQKVKFAYGDCTFEVIPTIEHSTYSNYPGFIQYEMNCDLGWIEHNITLELAWSALSKLVPNLSLAEVKRLGYLVKEEAEPKIIVAEILVKEYPVRWRQQLGLSWSSWLARFDEDSAAVGIRADEIVNDPRNLHALTSGSLYLLDRLDVHPLFRGQHIGLHLCRFTLKILAKNLGDMVFLLADPIDSKYPNGNYNTITDINRLAEYYITAGFRFVRVQPDEQILLEEDIGSEFYNVPYFVSDAQHLSIASGI